MGVINTWHFSFSFTRMKLSVPKSKAEMMLCFLFLALFFLIDIHFSLSDFSLASAIAGDPYPFELNFRARDLVYFLLNLFYVLVFAR